MLIYDGTEYRNATAEEEAKYENLPPEPISDATAEEALNIILGETP